eukprot:8886083-Alexandrium_andersonii.AAC.1
MGHARATPCVCHAVARRIACRLCRRRARGTARSAARPALGSPKVRTGPWFSCLAPRRARGSLNVHVCGCAGGVVLSAPC